MKNKVAWVIIGSLVLLAGVAIAVFAFKQNKGPIPSDIKKQITFSVYLPSNDVGEIDKSSITFNASERALSFAVVTPQQRVAISEQAEPDIFNEGPIFSNLLNKMRQYQQIQTAIGTVTLTNPEELKGGQTAVANQSGTLLFARPDKNMTEQQWREFFNGFEVLR